VILPPLVFLVLTVDRTYAKERWNIRDEDFFIWETHIFFDDAFEPDDSGKLTVVNQVTMS
jgi:hypothetical protein